MRSRPTVGGSSARNLDVVIIGAGISGILMGILLKQRGIESFRILEKAGSIGGTWRDNRYPGLTCDVPSHAYTYSFAPNPDWTHRYATGADILAYYSGVAERFGIVPHVSCDSEVMDAQWDGAAWQLTLKDGTQISADVVVSAVGRLHHPRFPDIPGLGSFAGPAFHSARWDEGVELAGKRVGIIGTGSTSAQITTAIADEVQSLVVFQRSPHWVLGLHNFRINPALRWLLKLVPGAARWYHKRKVAEAEANGRRILGSRDARQARIDGCHAVLASIRDPELRRKLTPSYEVGCKRMVISEGFPMAIQKPNVILETDGIEQIEPDGVRTRDGGFHSLDVLILATGFKADAFMRPMTIRGEDGITLDRLWAEGFLNYRSVAMPHMPNFFMINGPYSPGGSSPIVGIAEVHANYVCQLIDRIAADGIAITPSVERTKALLDAIRERGRQSIWSTGGCNSWYLDEGGVPIVNPITVGMLAVEMAKPDMSDFVVSPLTKRAKVGNA